MSDDTLNRALRLASELRQTLEALFEEREAGYRPARAQLLRLEILIGDCDTHPALAKEEDVR